MGSRVCRRPVCNRVGESWNPPRYPWLMRNFLLAFLLATSALAADEHEFIAKNFHFHDGSTLGEVRLHYVTFGKLSGDNAVLILHGTGGSSKQFLNDHFAGVLFKDGGLLDARRYLIVIPDNIGQRQ